MTKREILIKNKTEKLGIAPKADKLTLWVESDAGEGWLQDIELSPKAARKVAMALLEWAGKGTV